MDMYQHDSVDNFRFVLKGELSETDAHELKWAWKTAKSILNGKDLIIEVSGVTKVAPAGIDLLSRLRQSGARISATHLPECEELLRLLVCCESEMSGAI